MGAVQKQLPSGNWTTEESKSGDLNIDADADNGKQIATVKAELVVPGVAVQDKVTGGWLVARWGRRYHYQHLVDPKAFLRCVGGAA
jgi:hypothetical protein